MKVSVIIPIYNVRQYLEECIASVAAQTFRDFELIAVDDCSTDDSRRVLDSSLEKYPLIQAQVKIIRHERNKGLSAARNTGLQASQGEFVFFLDSDDTITPDCLQLLVAASRHKGKDVDMVVGDYRFDGPPLGCPHLRVGRSFLKQRSYIRAYCKERIYPMAWNRLLRRDFLLQHQLFFEEGLIHEDTLWNFQMLPFLHSVSIVEHETYVYRVHQQSIQTSTAYEHHFRASAYITGRMADIMLSTPVLRYNHYVYNFVEQEKLRHLDDCYRHNSLHLVRELYSVCRTHPHYQPWQAILLFGLNFGTLKRILQRDMHYSKPFEEGLAIFDSHHTPFN
ncbi:MAG: glycosyltransferase family 2 protein [Bacteroidaceae bacterium]|nr:glycosyltransferase family 2 protein [Bacteroidaceae bacterium]